MADLVAQAGRIERNDISPGCVQFLSQRESGRDDRTSIHRYFLNTDNGQCCDCPNRGNIRFAIGPNAVRSPVDRASGHRGHMRGAVKWLPLEGLARYDQRAFLHHFSTSHFCSFKLVSTTYKVNRTISEEHLSIMGSQRVLVPSERCWTTRHLLRCWRRAGDLSKIGEVLF